MMKKFEDDKEKIRKVSLLPLDVYLLLKTCTTTLLGRRAPRWMYM
jgi:hypothetical protein